MFHIGMLALYFVLVETEEIKVSHVKCQFTISHSDSSVEDRFERDEP